jgi:hypothetical protein
VPIQINPALSWAIELISISGNNEAGTAGTRLIGSSCPYTNETLKRRAPNIKTRAIFLVDNELE